MLGVPVAHLYRRSQTPLLLAVASLALTLAVLQSELLWLPPPWDEWGRAVYRTAFFLCLPFRVIVAFFLPRVDHHWPLAHHLVTTLGAPFFYYLLWRIATYLTALWRKTPSHRDPVPDTLIDRRQFLARSAVGSIGCVATGVTGYSALVEPGTLAVRDYRIAIRDLPPRFDGLRICQVSDTHFGPYTSESFIRRALAHANALKPDVYVLTGDYVHFTSRAIPKGLHVFEMLESRLGAVAVLGNHDHWEGAQACREALTSIGIPAIDNARVFLTQDGLTREHVNGAICIAGVGDLWEDAVSIEKALGGVREDMPRLLLSHNPDVAESLDRAYRVDVMLSGHTHGGQINLPRLGAPVTTSRFGDKYLGGLCAGPSCPVVVSRGVGLAGVPVRFRVPPELVMVELVRA